MWLLLALGCTTGENQINKLYPDIQLTTEVLDFGEVVRDYTLELDLPVTNAGPVDLTVTGAEIGGEDAAQFAVVSVPTEIPAGETLYVRLSFTPDNFLSYSAIVTVQSDDPDGVAVAVLTGSGINAPTPDIGFDPSSVDFGTVAVGATTYMPLTLLNGGDDTLLIESIRIDGSAAFTLDASSNPTGIVAGDQYGIPVYYSPTVDTGDNAVLTVVSNDPDEPEASVILLGNGGGDYDCPVPLITGPTDATPLETVLLDGSGSVDPDGSPLADYDWTVLRGASTANLVTTDANQGAWVTFNAAGTYEIALDVTDEYGVSCEPYIHTVSVVPADQIHIELLWDTASADMDLHLLEGGGEFFRIPDDCNWCNQTSSWGGVGSGDDPTLTLDDRYGYGPENITIDEPAEGDYEIRVHYYAQNGDTDVVATLNVYLRGVLAGTWSKVMTYDDVWEVADIHWDDEAADTTVTEHDIALYNASRGGCYE